MVHRSQALAGVRMRGTDEASGLLFSYIDLKARIPARHPWRTIRQVVNDALTTRNAEFEALYTSPCILPERFALSEPDPDIVLGSLRAAGYWAGHGC